MTDIPPGPCCTDADRSDGFAHDPLTHALRARLAEVEAERDLLRKQGDHAAAFAGDVMALMPDEWGDEMPLPPLPTDGSRPVPFTAEAVALAWVKHLAAENARMRPVVEAAEAVDRAWRYESGTGVRVVGPLRAQAVVLDAYRAGQNTPASPPQSTLGDEKASEVAQDVRDGPEAHRPAEAVCICNPRHREEDPICQWRPATETDQPADPPGLDAAIEAAARALVSTEEHRSWDDPPVPPGAVDGWRESYRRQAAIVVRAAAPALRAGALREAADDLAALAEKWNGTPGFAKALRYAAARIRARERADRIGGAT